MTLLNIRQATQDDHAPIWQIIGPVIRQGETLALPRNTGEAKAVRYWTGPDRRTFIAEESGVAVGTYYIRPNQLGGGSHVANCGYVTRVDTSRKGVARAMCEHSLSEARRCGFRAMQFNFVISTNERAVRLWRDLKFREVGRLPAAFQRPDGNFVDALVMFREL